jgi:hypothetical protein
MKKEGHLLSPLNFNRPVVCCTMTKGFPSLVPLSSPSYSIFAGVGRSYLPPLLFSCSFLHVVFTLHPFLFLHSSSQSIILSSTTHTYTYTEHGIQDDYLDTRFFVCSHSSTLINSCVHFAHLTSKERSHCHFLAHILFTTTPSFLRPFYSSLHFSISPLPPPSLPLSLS